LAVVVALGCVSVLSVPVAASTTVAPGIALPNPSLAVTVIVELPVPAAIGDVAVTVGWVAGGAGGVTTTVALCVIATPSMVAETVFDSATTELSVPVATPLAFVTLPGWVRVFPVPVAARTTGAPAIAFPNPSFAVTVIVAVPVPAAIGEVAVTVD